MSKLIDKILTEWSYRVHDGMPDVKNPLHILELKNSMQDMNLPNKFIFEFIQNLFEDNNKKKRLIQKLGLKNIEWNDYEDKQGNLWRWSDDENNFIEKGKSDKTDKTDTQGDEGEPEQDKQTTQKVTKIDKHQFKGDDESPEVDDSATEKPDINKLSSDDLRTADHNTTDKQLNFTKAEAKAQAKQKGEKGVGLGTPESRAGEAAVHYAMRELTSGGKSIDDVSKVLMGLAKDKDKVLNKKWAKAAVNTAKWINEVYGNDIKEVVWDTPEGRKLIGVEGHGTSSDMFIQTKNGRNIGISLKQTTQVFLLNGGYDKQHKLLVSSLSESLGTEEIEAFKAATSIDTYWHGGADGKGFNGDLETIGSEFSTNKEFKNLIGERLEFYKNNPEVFEKNNIFDSDKYIPHLDNTFKIIEKLPHVNSEEKKYIAKIMKDPAVRKQFPQFYDALRGQEVTLTKKILNQAKSNPNVADGLKKLCLKGMHAEDILFASTESLDEFITLYGNNPAVELDKGILLNIFDMKADYEKYLSITDDEDPEGHMREELKETMMADFNKKLIIDMKDDAKSGEVRIKHSGPPEQEFHLFGVKARAKALGASPALEMNQTSFMGNVIKEGTPDISKWKTSTKNRYVNTRIKELEEEFEDSNTEQRQAINDEIKALRAL